MVEIKGIISPILTPMKSDESVNYEELRVQINRLINGGIHGIFVFGTNGEGYILSEEEKIEIMRVAVEEVNGRVPVYASTGLVGTKDTIRLSQKAKEVGVDVLSNLTPSLRQHHKRSCIPTLKQWLKTWICQSFYTISQREPAMPLLQLPLVN